ncbi:MAG: hypothetical protein ABF868_11820 [Sporolactobacillus sp.]
MNVNRKSRALLILYFFLILAVKVALVSGIRVWGYIDGPYDDGMMLNNTTYLLNHQWLGPFNEFTLAKGIVFPLYVAFIHQIGIPYLLSLVLMQFIACAALILSVRKFIIHKTVLALLYTVLMFNPISTYYNAFNRFYRDSLYSYFFLLLFACLISLFLNRNESVWKMVFLSSCSGIFLSSVWLMREDSPWLLPFVICSVLVTGISICRNRILVHKIRRMLVLAIIPLILFFSLFSVSLINYKYYCFFGTNEFMNGSLPVLVKDLSSIKPNKWEPQVPIPKSTREKAYRVSPTFAKIKPYLENDWVMKAEHGNPTCDLMIWGIVDAVQNAGMNTAPATQEFYRKSANEIEKAFASGKLKKRGSYISIFESPWDNRYILPLLSSVGKTLHMLVFFENYPLLDNGKLYAKNTYAIGINGTIDGLKELERNTNNQVYYSNEPLVQGHKIKLINRIDDFYTWINPVATVIGLGAYIYICACFFIAARHRNREGICYWGERCLVLTGLLLSCLARIFLLSYSNVSCNFMLYPTYLAPGYWLILIFVLLSLATAGQDILKAARRHHTEK